MTWILEQLEQMDALRDSERRLLQEIQQAPRTYPEQAHIHEAEAAKASVHILRRGWACAVRLLSDGRRQILEIFLPGQVMGLRDIGVGGDTQGFLALTEVEICSFPRDRLRPLFQRSPQLAELLFEMLAREQSVLAERLVNIGRRPAAQRLAHFLMEMQVRLNPCSDRFELPLSQSILGDALGLSSVHVSRTFKQLKQAGLVQMDDGVVIVRDLERLAEYAEFDPEYLLLARPKAWAPRSRLPQDRVSPGATRQGLRPSNRWSPAGNEEDDRQDQPDHEEYPGDVGCRSGNAGQTQSTGNDGNDQKEKRQIEHGNSPPFEL
jgi:CRP-like cAMP-binding protein